MTDEEIRLECLKLTAKDKILEFGEIQINQYEKANEYVEYVKTGKSPAKKD